MVRMASVDDWVEASAAYTAQRAANMEEMRQTTPGPSKGPESKLVINPFFKQ